MKQGNQSQCSGTTQRDSVGKEVGGGSGWGGHMYTHGQFMFSSVTQSCLTLRPMDCSLPGFPVHHHLLEFAQTHVASVDDAIHPSHPLSPLILLPSIFPSIKVFSSESVLQIWWPKYWNFSYSFSPFNE